MTIREYKKEDLDMVGRWWFRQTNDILRPNLLSTTGFVVEGSTPLCAGWLYMTNSDICYFENVVKNPEEDCNEAIDLLFQHAAKEAKRLDFKVMYSMTEHDKLIERGLSKHKYRSLDNLKVFVRSL